MAVVTHTKKHKARNFKTLLFGLSAGRHFAITMGETVNVTLRTF